MKGTVDMPFINMFPGLVTTNKGDCFDIRMITDTVYSWYRAMDNVQHTRRET